MGRKVLLMSAAVTHPLPSLKLPVAFLRFWSLDGDGRRAHEMAAKLTRMPGIEQLGDGFLAALPVDGRASVFDTAVRLGPALLARLGKVDAAEEVSGLLVFPGQVVCDAEGISRVDDPFLEDLERHPPRLPSQQVYLTGYAASWLGGRYGLEDKRLYDGPSGRRVPLLRLAGEARQPLPWHNLRILGRQVAVERPEVARALAAAVAGGTFQVTGPLGSGKSHAVWHALERLPGEKIWIDLGRALPDTAMLARRLVKELYRLAPQSRPPRDELRRPEALAPERAAELLIAWLRGAGSSLGEPLWLVFDSRQTATEGDARLLAQLAAAVRETSACRLVAIGRGGAPDLPGLPRVEVPPLAPAEAASHGRELFEGLSVGEELEARWVRAAAGCPFALEEGLMELVHQGLVRQVYGSYFYNGGSETEYAPSQRWVRHVEAELQRLGEPLPLRILAASGESCPAARLELAAATFGVELGAGWEAPFLAAGWLREAGSPQGPELEFASPAHKSAMIETVTSQGAGSLRHALGEVIAGEPQTPEKEWQAYRLMAGSPEALPTLLDFSRAAASDQASRDEIFGALLSEYRQHQERQDGEAVTELDLLWCLLPLAHRLGRLSDLQPELRRAIELAVENPQRYVALLTLQSELDLEQGRFREAERSLRLALGESDVGGDKQQAALLVRLGTLLQRQGRLPEAREIFENLLQVVDRGKSTSLGATCNFHLGNIALKLKQLDEAMAHHRKAREVREQLRLKKPLGASWTAIGAVHLALGDYPKALGFYRQAKQVMDEQGGSELGFAYLGSGRALTHLGDHTAATKPLRQALEVRRGRDDVAGEAIARLEVAANQLALGNANQALEEARQGHFQLSLLPENTLLGDAEQLLGRILMRQQKDSEAQGHFREGMRIHLKYSDKPQAALDCSWLLELALRHDEREAILTHCSELEAFLDDLEYPTAGETLYYRLYRAFDWLSRHDHKVREPLIYLRRAYQELMRKTGYLNPEMRHTFLYQIPEHQEVVDAATQHNLSWPGI